MATTRVMTTVLPYSVDPNDPFHVSLYISHRLEGGGTLAEYPVMQNWVKALREATFQLHTDSSPSVISCTPLLNPDPDPRIVPPSEAAWKTAFPLTTAVRDYPKPVVTKTPWRSYPANRMRDHALDAHYSSACSCPVNRPPVADNPLAMAVLTVLGNSIARPSRLLVTGLLRYPKLQADRREKLIRARADAARKVVTPQPPVRPSASLAARTAPIPDLLSGSPIEGLLGLPEFDTDVTAFLNRLLENPQLITSPILRMLADVHAAQRYYNRPEEAKPYRDTPIAGHARPRTPHASPDFHERAASTANVPTLSRTLGFVVDVRVQDLDALRTANLIRCDVIVDGAEQYLSPETHCMTVGSRFLARPASDRWRAGRLGLGDPSRYRVMDLDPDAAGLSLEQHLRGVVRALAIEANGDRSTFAPAALRSTGFCLAELNRPNDLHARLQQAEDDLEPVVQVPGTAQPRPKFNYEGLLRGMRVDVWDDVTNIWHSLHERRVNATFNKKPILTGRRDTGYLQNPPLSRTRGADDDQHPYYVHEVLAGWDGWSLSAPRPGKLVIHRKTGEETVTSKPENITDNGQAPGIEVQSTAEPNSLPALRYGRKYSFRIAGVDLAGNSVPMDRGTTADPQQPMITAAIAHLDALRADAAQREQAGVFATLRADGLTQPRPPYADGIPGEIERATASAVEHASVGRMNPQLDIDPKKLAALFTDSGDPDTVSTPRPFLRWDPIPAPTLVPRVAYTPGESLQRMVIRTGLAGPPGLCERHIVPPKGSEMEAELDGRFDALMRAGNHVRAFAIALKERGNLFHTRIQDLNSPTRTIPQPGMALLATPGATNLETLANLQKPNTQPAEGQYIVHDVNNLVLPYLPDPMADGVALVFCEAGADHRMSNPRVLQSVVIKYRGQWPELQPLRLVLHTAPRLDAQQEGNVIKIGLPPGEQVAVALSTTLDAQHLDKMALWTLHPIQDPNVPDADRDNLARAARDGWLWWLTPDDELRLVHATARPARAPMITQLKAEPRAANVVTASLDGVIDVHGASTDKIELRAWWDDLIDDPANDEPTVTATKEIVVEHRIETHERHSLLTLQPDAEVVGKRTSEVNIRTAIHNLPDTKARTVNYRLHGTSRYREFFQPNELPPPEDERSAGNKVAVNILSSAAPAPPVAHSVIPLFGWEQTSEPEHPFAIRRIRRSGVRVWLQRPWYSSGDGELLAILTTGDPAIVHDNEKVSLWARDPIIAGPKMTNTYEVPVLSAWQQRAAQLALTPLDEPGRPVMHVVKQRKSNRFAHRDKVVNAYMFRPEFHRPRKLWFVDVILDSTNAIWPFLRLSLARYQPNSIPGMEFSEVVATDFVQLPPERIATLSRPDTGEVRVTVTGVTAVTAEPGAERPTPPTDAATLRTGLSKSRQVKATLQARAAGSKSDLDWTDVREVPCDLAGVDATTFNATWTGALKLEPAEQLLTPGTSDELRVQIEEYEKLPADPKPGEQTLSTTERLVYADQFPL